MYNILYDTYIILPFTTQLKWLQFKLVKNPMKNQSIPMLKIEELKINQKLNYDSKFVRRTLKESLINAIRQIGHINCTL